MKKDLKWAALSMSVVCMALSLFPSVPLYNVKADTDNKVTVEAVSGTTELEETANLEVLKAEETKKAAEKAREEAERKEAEAKKKAEEEAKKKEEEAKKKAEEAKKKAEAEKKAEEAKKNAYNIKMSDKDKENLYRLVQSEVGYMDEKSKMFVASVVLNRVKHKSFPNNVTDVVLAHNPRTGVYQFSPVAPGGRFWRCEVSKETKKAVDKVLKNGDHANGAIAFVAKRYTTAKAAAWFDNTLHHLFHHNGQDYYKYR